MSKVKHNNKLIGSGILLALSSSLCCIVPLLALLGTTGSTLSMFSWIAPLRPYLLMATALILGFAFYRAYKPTPKDGCGCPERKNWLQSKGFLWIVTALSIVLASFPYYAKFLQKKLPKQEISINSNVQQTVIQIQGMSCSSCEGHVNHALRERKGVLEVRTSYLKGESFVKFDSTQISIVQLVSSIEHETVYKVKSKKKDVN
ncbi:hypothetical protein OC25_08740 [Pedobacter kyungheensis]|uniref:Mercuric transport protein MerT n=1 Tax=Pedobacter kyungheensis TaxID=1069985 RepID=A0A0C1DL08_9SPHI|nr:mercuric transport protein MerTP [Pedobacter kyungheensis]KIA94740.1 hypothetical protein OC25_08740 [Pedobacter kyungheensis]